MCWTGASGNLPLERTAASKRFTFAGNPQNKAYLYQVKFNIVKRQQIDRIEDLSQSKQLCLIQIKSLYYHVLTVKVSKEQFRRCRFYGAVLSVSACSPFMEHGPEH